jgi:hypothetical protein
MKFLTPKEFLEEQGIRLTEASSSHPALSVQVSAEAEKELREAVKDYKWKTGRANPNCVELLAIIISLGYKKS